MESEKKYSIVGKVEIGTDEYRDLIEGLSEATKEVDKQRSDWCKEYSRANKAEERIKMLMDENERLNGFIQSSEEIKTKFKLYLVEQQMANEEEENEWQPYTK